MPWAFTLIWLGCCSCCCSLRQATFIWGGVCASLGQDTLSTQRLTPSDPEDAASATDAVTAAPASSSEPTATLNAEPSPPTMAIPAADLAQIEGIFGIDTYFRTETIPYQEGAIFRGNLRGQPAETRTRLAESLQERVGDRYRLFLVENIEKKPTVVVLPATADPPKTTPFQWVVAAALAIVTVFTSLEAGAVLQGFDLMQQFSRWTAALPYLMGLMMVVAGILASLVALAAFSTNPVRYAEDLLPDHEQMTAVPANPANET
ncbi:MAG: hypothetical protein HC922_07920 [Leptolyngbyaceae cyanobacterium SM2_3_12]|nr:hypothetical protein [Leptolyngbyaceae cyanobacterium SM2_3_12]